MAAKKVPTHNGKLPHGHWPLEDKMGVMLNFTLFIAGLYPAGTLNHTRDEIAAAID